MGQRFDQEFVSFYDKGQAEVIAAPSAFARLVAATGTLSKTDPPDRALFDRICAEIGDEILGSPGTLPSA